MFLFLFHFILFYFTQWRFYSLDIWLINLCLFALNWQLYFSILLKILIMQSIDMIPKFETVKMQYSMKCYFLSHFALSLLYLQITSVVLLYVLTVSYCKISKYLDVSLFSLLSYMEILYHIYSGLFCYLLSKNVMIQSITPYQLMNSCILLHTCTVSVYVCVILTQSISYCVGVYTVFNIL